MVDIAKNIADVRDRIEAAANRAGRRSSDITLAAVSKKQPSSSITGAIAAGITDIAENYVQEALHKKQDLAAKGLTGIRWHLIGHLQTNKSLIAIQAFDAIQSVDSIRLASALSRAAETAGRKLDILIQVHLGGESTKSGLDPERVRDTAAEMAAFTGISVRGLMGIAPLGVDPRTYFRQLKGLFDTLDPHHRQVLSMGMSGDFETAIEEGATLVRVGTAIFGARQTGLTIS